MSNPHPQPAQARQQAQGPQPAQGTGPDAAPESAPDLQTLKHIAFYRFVQVQDPQVLADQLETSLASLDLLGSILVAHEGINGMVAGPAERVASFAAELEQSQHWGDLLSGIVIKTTDTRDMPFARRMIKVKPEIVPLGVDGVDAPGRVDDIWARDVSPAKWRELIARDDVVLLDNRNSFEYEVGHFAGAVDPGVVKFRDFADYVRDHADQWRDQGTTVAMYCTGGIRCEKASPWMQDLGLDVYQLEGGILNYFAQLPDADRDWNGECFVFDERVSLDTELKETELTRKEVLAIEQRLLAERKAELEIVSPADDSATATGDH